MGVTFNSNISACLIPFELPKPPRPEDVLREEIDRLFEPYRLGSHARSELDNLVALAERACERLGFEVVEARAGYSMRQGMGLRVVARTPGGELVTAHAGPQWHCRGQWQV
jgi:hypothetical protein